MLAGGCFALNIGTLLVAVTPKMLPKLFVEAPLWAAMVILTQVSCTHFRRLRASGEPLGTVGNHRCGKPHSAISLEPS
jgi:hypothetical protein